jgi:predicted AlkP superfamily phosphohydrolase/phosphomutase
MRTEHGARLLVLGLDGATWDVIEPLAGDLPNLRRLWTGGARARLRSTTPPMTLPAWSSILTGVNPGRHGFLDFTRRIPGTYRLEFLNATHRGVPTLHELLSARGQRVASIAVPTTWPPSAVDGIVVSGFDSPVATTVEASHCHPSGVYDELRRRFGGLRFADFQEAAQGPGWHAHALGTLLREVGRKEAVCDLLLARERWGSFMVVFGESDTASHHFWAFHDRSSPRHRPGLPHALGDVYRRLDAAVGRLSARADLVCVVSDHGFGGAGTLVLYLNRWLEQHGWLRFSGTSQSVAGDRLRQLALRLPVERLVRRVPAAWLGDVETRTRYGAIDFRHTRAWSDETNYAATIHLNVRGRDPLGTIDDVDAATRELTRLLLAWKVDGTGVVERVWRRDEVCRGPAAGGAPDLVLTFANPGGYSPTLLPSTRVAAGTTFRHLDPHELQGGKGLGMNGAHRPEGVLILHGAPFAAGVTVEASVEDVLPTLLHALGEGIPAHVEGHVLQEAFAGRRHERRVPAETVRPPLVALRHDEARHLADRLTALGYR